MLMKLLFGDVVREETAKNGFGRGNNAADFSEIVRMLGVEDYRDTHEVVERVVGPGKH